MDHKRNEENAAGSAGGMMFKAAALSAQEVTAEELKAINKHTIEPLTAEDVFTFSAVLCDNEVDRDHEHFSLKALQQLKKMFVGRTVIKDHEYTADNQIARIYSTELVTSEKILSSGEPYTQLKARCYMVKTDSNRDLITEIKAGIKKEGSVGFALSSYICSICGTDNAKSYCRHWPGKTYEKEGGSVVCTFKMAEVKDAYEFSLVPVPAQRAAGVSKFYAGGLMQEPDETPAEPAEENDDTEKALQLRARLAGVI